MITQSFDLNLIPDSAPIVVHCDQYDHGEGRLIANLYDDSIPYYADGSAMIQGEKPDGKGFAYNVTISGNTVTADLTDQMTAVAGNTLCQIVVTESTGRTGSFIFVLEVQKSALPSDTDMSESDYQAIQTLINLVNESVSAAAESAEDAEAWAVGQRSGVDVPSTDETYQNNSKYYAEQAQQYAQGGLHYKGSCLFADIPVSGMTDGDMWNIEDDFVTDSRFREGSGKSVAAGTNIAWIADISKWDVLAIPQTIPDMTLVAKGIGKPDGITTDVSSGTFSAKGVGIVADVNGNGTVHGADWLYYTGTTTVIVPNASQMYRVTISGTASLWYWDGTQYVQLASSGGGGGGASLVDVTTAQYNALTPAEKADPDVWYWINDMDGMSGTAIVIGTFAGLTDTNFTNLQDGQIATYNATTQKWENQDIVIPSGDYYELVDGTNIASGTNLNNLTTVGTYTKRAQSFKATNEPSDLTQYERYNLIVQMADNTKTVTTGSPLMQILYAHTRNTGEIKVYTRGYTVPVGWSAWVQMGGSGGASELSSLTDVNFSSLANGNLLRYDGTKWINSLLYRRFNCYSISPDGGNVTIPGGSKMDVIFYIHLPEYWDVLSIFCLTYRNGTASQEGITLYWNTSYHTTDYISGEFYYRHRIYCSVYNPTSSAITITNAQIRGVMIDTRLKISDNYSYDESTT